LGSLTFTARAVLQKPFRPLLPGVTRAPYNDVKALPYYITEDVASVIIEAVQGEGGIIIPDREFLLAVQEQCNHVGALLHVDEVQSGWGRTGHYFCCEHFGLEPDIITLGKAFGGGVFPHSALIANPKAFFGTRIDMPQPKGTPFKGMAENPWWLTNTFAGSQLACAASLATIEVFESENLMDSCRESGGYLLGRLKELVAANHDELLDVRGMGLWIGLECHTAEAGTRLADELFHRDVLVAQTINNPTTLRIQPPLIITREQIDDVLAALEDSIKAMAANPVSTG
jgi:putrescine aminotransferase